LVDDTKNTVNVFSDFVSVIECVSIKKHGKSETFKSLERKTVQTGSVLDLRRSGGQRFIILILYNVGINKSLDHERKYSTKGHEKESTHLDCK